MEIATRNWEVRYDPVEGDLCLEKFTEGISLIKGNSSQNKSMHLFTKTRRVNDELMQWQVTTEMWGSPNIE